MPLILATTDSPKSGPGYRDRTGERYEYPLQYQGLVSEGERFLYYRPGSRIYFGSGIVGRIGSSPSDPSRLMCEIENFVPFANPVPLRDQTNEYYEAAGPHPWPGWRNGVREISDHRFSRILGAAMTTAHLRASPSDDGPPPTEPPGGSRQTAAYAASDVAQAVEQYSVMVAVREARDRFPGETVRPMPHSNPGFDIWVGESDQRDPFH